jgi:ATP-binding cassette subfamily F protein 3
MIQFNKVSLQLGKRSLFTQLNFTLHAKEKVGLIGQNGAGKSTLFALLLGEIQADGGDIQLPKNLQLATVKQETPALAMPALEYVLDGDKVYREQQQKLEEAEAREDMNELMRIHERMEHTGFYSKPALAGSLLHGLGFSAEQQQQSVADFSGGWRMRLNLAQALIADSDVLLLDEPTNHLDLEAVLWLEDWLKNYPGILLIISHDREFLDNVVGHILWLENGEVKRFTGNYSAFESMRAMQLSQQQAAFEKHQRERAHLQKFIDRFRAQATKATQAQSRIKALERMGEMLPAHQASQFHFSFPEVNLASKAYLLLLSEATLGYDDKVILDSVQFGIAPGDRIGLLGPNGAGKSTLIKALAGQGTVLTGERLASQHLKLGYFSQHQLDILDPSQSPFWHIRQLSPKVHELEARKFLGQFDFAGDVVFESIQYFSGGEKARLALALIVWQAPNLLLLDEPTNHLDIEMRQALIMALQEYTGAVVVISHDRHLLRATTDELYLVYDGKVDKFAGSIDDYPKWWKAEQTKLNQQAQRELNPNSRKAQRQEAAAQREARKAYVQTCQKLEKQLSELHSKLAKLETQLADEGVYAPENKNQLTEALRQQAEIKSQANKIEEAWLAAMAELDAFDAAKE